MPWVLSTDEMIYCGECAGVMEKYAVCANGDCMIYVAERCVTCRTQFNYEPSPDYVPFGSIPDTGGIKWEALEEDEKYKRKKSRHNGCGVLGRPGIQARRDHKRRRDTGR